MNNLIPFNRPTLTGRELLYVADAILSGHTAGQGEYTKRCERLLEQSDPNSRVLLTNSCTSALEMSALALGLVPGDEVIVPSYTFVSTANAFYKFGVKPVLCDINADDLNINVEHAASLISERTRAIVPVHYAGVPCDLSGLMNLCRDGEIRIVEDAAHCDVTFRKESGCGTGGILSAFSFHETKNFNCGEGGALVVNDPELVDACEIIRDKGTDRSRFFRGEVDKYSWVSAGSSYVMADLLAAFLFAQLEDISEIREKRRWAFEKYADGIVQLEQGGNLEFPLRHQQHASHMCYILVDSAETRRRLLSFLKKHGIHAVFHYVPLHTSEVGRRLGYRPSDCPVSVDISERLVRLPFYYGISEQEISLVLEGLKSFFVGNAGDFSDLVQRNAPELMSRRTTAGQRQS